MVASCTTSYWSWRVGVRTLRLPWSPSTPRRSCWTNSRGGQNIASGCWQALASVMGHPVFPSQCVLMRTVRTSSKTTPPGWGLRCGKGKGNLNRVTTHHIPWLTHFLDSAVQFSRPEHNMLIWHKINSQYWFTVSLFHQTSYDIPFYFHLAINICYNYCFIVNEFNKNFIAKKKSLTSVVTDKSAIQSLTAVWAELQYTLLVPVWIVLQECTWLYNVIKSYIKYWLILSSFIEKKLSN